LNTGKPTKCNPSCQHSTGGKHLVSDGSACGKCNQEQFKKYNFKKSSQQIRSIRELYQLEKGQPQKSLQPASHSGVMTAFPLSRKSERVCSYHSLRTALGFQPEQISRKDIEKDCATHNEKFSLAPHSGS
jgi:hypothetical protein